MVFLVLSKIPSSNGKKGNFFSKPLEMYENPVTIKNIPAITRTIVINIRVSSERE
jgi:hypothetical protein